MTEHHPGEAPDGAGGDGHAPGYAFDAHEVRVRDAATLGGASRSLAGEMLAGGGA